MAATHTMALPAALARVGLPARHIRRVIENCKIAGFVTHGRPGVGRPVPLTAQDIARLIIGLACQSQARAVRFAREVGEQPLLTGDGPPSAEQALTEIIESAVWLRPPPIALDGGEIEIGQSHPGLRITGWSPSGEATAWHYTSGPRPPGARANFLIPIPTVAAIGRDVLIGQT